MHSLNTVAVGYHESLLKKQINRVREMMIYITLEPHTCGAINGEIDDKEIFWCPSAFTQPGKANEETAGVRNRSYFKAHTVPTLENSVSCGSCSSFGTKLCLVCCSFKWTDRPVLKAQLQGPGFGNFIAWSANKVPGNFKAYTKASYHHMRILMEWLSPSNCLYMCLKPLSLPLKAR